MYSEYCVRRLFIVLVISIARYNLNIPACCLYFQFVTLTVILLYMSFICFAKRLENSLVVFCFLSRDAYCVCVFVC